MSIVASRDLRNHTAQVLREVAQGGHVTVTVNGTAVAEIIPVQQQRRLSIPGEEMLARLRRVQADPALRDDLRALAGDTTDDLGPIR